MKSKKPEIGLVFLQISSSFAQMHDSGLRWAKRYFDRALQDMGTPKGATDLREYDFARALQAYFAIMKYLHETIKASKRDQLADTKKSRRVFEVSVKFYDKFMRKMGVADFCKNVYFSSRKRYDAAFSSEFIADFPYTVMKPVHKHIFADLDTMLSQLTDDVRENRSKILRRLGDFDASIVWFDFVIYVSEKAKPGLS